MRLIQNFDVITSSGGESRFSIPIACRTVEAHYQRTTGERGKNSDVCSTGLRVYEGAQVLSSLLSQYTAALLGPCAWCSSQISTENHSNTKCVIELGCGCALASFTLNKVLKEREQKESYENTRICIICTDASEECLDLVRTTAQLPFHASTSRETKDAFLCSNHLEAFPFLWGDEGITQLKNFLFSVHQKVPMVQLLLGSDILYYRVDIHLLLSTIKQLLHFTNADRTDAPLAVLCHFMRIPNGREKLLRIAEEMNLCVAQLSLMAFLDSDVVFSRGWGGLEVLLLIEKPADAPIATNEELIANLLGNRCALFSSANLIDEAKQCTRLCSFIKPYGFVENDKSDIFSIDL